MWNIIGQGLKLLEILLEHGSPTSIDAAKSLVKKLTHGYEGNLTVTDIAAEFQALHDHLAANDAAAFKLLHDRFAVKPA